MGGDDLTIIEICLDVEDEFGIEIYDEELELLTTIGKYLQFITERLGTVTINPPLGGEGPPPTLPGSQNPTIPGGGVIIPPPLPPPASAYDCDRPSTNDSQEFDQSSVWEPKWGQLGNYASIRGEVIAKISNTADFTSKSLYGQLSSLAEHFYASRNFTRQNGNIVDKTGSMKVDRYIYSATKGWIDMNHFFQAARIAELWKSAQVSVQIMTAVELSQAIGNDYPSAYSSEDYRVIWQVLNFG